MSEDIQAQVALRICSIGDVDVETIAAIEEGLQMSLAAVSTQVQVASGPKTLVEILNNAERSTERVILDALNNQEFVFSVVDLDGFQRDPLNPRITASSAGTQCVIVGDFPVGHNVEVKELLDHTAGGVAAKRLLREMAVHKGDRLTINECWPVLNAYGYYEWREAAGW
jgi:hypothetical protein